VDKKLRFEYDPTGDIMYIEKCPPYPEQDSEELEDFIVARTNPKTGEVESLEILFWSARLNAGKPLELPITAELHLASRA
jgi:uncharacterized protein YuzE